MIAPKKSYGQGRIHKNVSYEDVERAAIGILKSERRPTVETVRNTLGGGSPNTIGTALRRFWRDLGARIEGDPAALTRMPAEIAEIADGIWQRALALAGESANSDNNAAKERLNQLQIEVEIRRRSFELREREIDDRARERERSLTDAREHLLSLSKALSREQANNEALRARVADLDAQIEQFRSQIGHLIAGAITRGQTRSKATKTITGSPRARLTQKRPIVSGRHTSSRRNSKKAESKKRLPTIRSRKFNIPKVRPRKR